MFESLIHRRFTVALILLVFLFFLLNIAGLMDLRLYLTPDFALRENLISHLLSRSQLTLQFARLEFVLFILTGILLAISLPLLSPIKASGLTLACMLAPVYLALSQPGSSGLLTMEYHLLTILILFAVNVLLSYFIQTREKQQLMDIFGHYVPRELVDALSEHPEGINLAGEARELTVLFCDIKGFTEISEKLEPRQLAAFLNAYFTDMTRILFKHGATIDKYMGDAIMAFWGAPLPQADHASRAVSAALEMQASLIPLAEAFSKKNWPPIELGIGINTGVMNVGNMGSEYRLAYTVVGDAVNLGSRLEHLTRRYAVKIIVSDSTRNACQNFRFRELDRVVVKGKENISRIHEPIGLLQTEETALQEELTRHQLALDHYYLQEWDASEHLFTELHASAENAFYYELFLSRIAAFRDIPPDPGWTGETTYSTL